MLGLVKDGKIIFKHQPLTGILLLFAEACESCRIKFIGPDQTVMRLMGDKARARRAMKKAGVKVLPGSDGPVEGLEKAQVLGKKLGFPLIIKATAGGGGRG